MDGLVDRILFSIPLAFHPTLSEMESATTNLSTEVVQDFNECFENILQNTKYFEFVFAHDAQELLRTTTDQFVTKVNEAIKDGKALPK